MRNTVARWLVSLANYISTENQYVSWKIGSFDNIVWPPSDDMRIKPPVDTYIVNKRKDI